MSGPIAKTITEDEYFYGHKACAGCGGALAVRIALKVLGRRAVAVLPAGCMSAVGFNYPNLCFANNAIISTFAGTASMMTGIEAGLKARGLSDYTVVGFAGDGGTADIGLQALSGCIDRNDDVIYICYDNEAYMNTGTQKSSLTPFGASTTTTPARSIVRGNTREKAAHGIPYAATASVGYLDDYMMKVEKASRIRGTKFIHVLAPCPTGWGARTDMTVELARKAVDTGLWRLEEFENGEFRLNRGMSDPAGIRDYIRSQKRFAHLTDEDIAHIERFRDARWKDDAQGRSERGL